MSLHYPPELSTSVHFLTRSTSITPLPYIFIHLTIPLTSLFFFLPCLYFTSFSSLPHSTYIWFPSPLFHSLFHNFYNPPSNTPPLPSFIPSLTPLCHPPYSPSLHSQKPSLVHSLIFPYSTLPLFTPPSKHFLTPTTTNSMLPPLYTSSFHLYASPHSPSTLLPLLFPLPHSPLPPPQPSLPSSGSLEPHLTTRVIVIN